MAWEKRLLDASFRGIVFDCQLADDDWERHAVEHARPFVDGAEMEDMGRGARRIRMKAIFFGDDYEERLEKFLKALDEPGPGDLVHPVFGPLKAQVLTPHVHHESELVDQAEVELTFAESGLGRPIFGEATAGQKAAGIGGKTSGARSAAASVLASVVAKCADANAMARSGLRAMAEMKGQAGGVITSGAGILTAPASWAADLASLVRGVVDLRSFGASSLLPDFSAVFAALTSAILLPSDSGSSGSSGSGYAAAYPVTEGPELDVVTAHVELERALGVAEAAQVVLESEADTPTLTPDEVESVAADSRELLQASIETYRGQYPVEQARAVAEPLRDVALAVQDAAKAVIEARPPLVSHTVSGRTCPRLLAHQLYGDHGRAPEIVRLNTVADPNFLTGGEVLRVYAS